MVLIGEFREEIINEDKYLVYHNVEYPSPQINPNSSNKVVIDDLPIRPLFLCPSLRVDLVEEDTEDQKLFKITNSPLYDGASGHRVHPLSWCSNERAEFAGECGACIHFITTSYYYCGECDKRYHKECVESPLDIFYPSHSKLSPHFTHSLQLFHLPNTIRYCSYCENNLNNMVYYCTLCDCYFHIFCAMTPLPFFISVKNIPDFTLTIFPREASLICNVCGTVDKHKLLYICAKRNFVVHSSCIFSPKTVRISRHEHRISFISSFLLKEWLCKVCHKWINCDYGAFACNLCSDYFVHTKCGLRMDLCDRIELEGVPEEEYEDVEPFERRYDGDILHFSHDHPLRLFEVSKQVVYDENKFCQACGLSIYEGNFYSCLDCNFILHEVCANAPRKRFSLVHCDKLNLELTTKPECSYCAACFRDCNGFFYTCPVEGCCFESRYVLCLRCALVSEPFIYQGHQHPLFQSLDPKVKHTCHVCKSQDITSVLSCVESECGGIIICFKCATLPFVVKYKHDEHYLTFHRGEEASPDSDWCELCEGKLANGSEAGFYACDHCCTTLHIKCLLGPEPYLMPGKVIEVGGGGEFHVRRNNSSTREYCITCKRRCPYPTVFVSERGFSCSLRCAKKSSLC